MSTLRTKFFAQFLISIFKRLLISRSTTQFVTNCPFLQMGRIVAFCNWGRNVAQPYTRWLHVHTPSSPLLFSCEKESSLLLLSSSSQPPNKSPPPPPLTKRSRADVDLAKSETENTLPLINVNSMSTIQ